MSDLVNIVFHNSFRAATKQMIRIDREVGESLIIEDPANGLNYRVAVVRVSDGEEARLAVDVTGPSELSVISDGNSSETSIRLQLEKQ